MKHWLLLSLCLLISGCGLFRKTTKTEVRNEQKTETAVSESSSSTTHAAIEESVNVSKRTDTSEQQTRSDRESRDVDVNTKIEANQIQIDKDGKITATGNAKLSSNKKDNSLLESQTNTNRTGKTTEDSSDRYTGKFDATTEADKDLQAGTTVKQSDKKIVNDPKGSAWIWIAVGVVIVFGGIWIIRKKL